MNYLLDTNVISETAKTSPDPKVLNFLESTPMEQLYLSALTLGELSQGIARAPENRKDRLLRWFNGVKYRFSDRILPLDAQTLELWGRILGESRQKGEPLPALDAMLAATALKHDLILVTRNTKHFLNLPLLLLNPWNE